MKKLIKMLQLSLFMFLSYALFIMLYALIICATPVPVIFTFILCNVALGVGILVWMKKIIQKTKMSQQEFGLSLTLFCLEYYFVWNVLHRLKIDEILEWPIHDIIYLINSAYRKYYVPISTNSFMPYNIVELDIWMIHGLAIILYLLLLVILKICLNHVNQ